VITRIARNVTKHSYARIAKPILFRQKPDTVHEGLIKTARALQRIPLLRSAPGLWQYQHPMLRQTVLGIEFNNPVGLAAGFDKNFDMISLMKRVGFGYMTGGSVTAQPCDGNPKPWFYRLPNSKSLVVHAGLPNPGVQRVVRAILQYPAKVFDDFPLVVSVAKTNSRETKGDDGAIEDYCASLKLLEERQACQIYEINISCPNTYGGEPFTTPARLELLLARVDELALSRPIVLKMPIDLGWSEFEALAAVAVRHASIKGLTIGNLLKDRSKAQLSDELSSDVKGGLSGRVTRDLSTELIRATYRRFGDRFVIIGVGGVASAEDAYEKICAGATLVELITAMIFEGPQVVGDINSGLVQLLRADGHASIADAVGSRVDAQ
jgi:dihydroorotate dehydrogenase